MTNQKTSYPQLVFWSVCAVVITWAAVTLFLEFRMGWPADRAAWGHRIIGWFINFVLVRTFFKGVRRYYAPR